MIPPDTTILLIGLRGSGKSSVARLLAQRLARGMVDLDDLSPGYLGERSTGDALRRHGEPAFRRAELAAMQEMLRTRGRVVALGGGTPTAPGVAEMLEGARKQGQVRIIYLRATEPTLKARLIAEAGDRPSLTGKGTLEEIGVLLNLRDTLYKTLATDVIDVDGKGVEAVADELARKMME